jgi:hypothetical protein
MIRQEGLLGVLESRMLQHLYQRQKHNPSNCVLELGNDINLSLESYEFPSYKEEGNSTKWAIKAYDGIKLLRPIMDMLSSTNTAKVEFFDLSAELRNTIHAMVFQYPTESGLASLTWVSRASVTRFEMCHH